MMNFTFEDRPYSGKNFRPRPEIHLDKRTGLMIVATPWGARQSAKSVIEKVTDYLMLAQQDIEATSPFQGLSYFSRHANNLRTAVLLANDYLFRNENKEEYRSGVELFAASVENQELVWLQVGHPQVFLSRANHALLPIGTQHDLSFDLSGQSPHPLPALPGQMLGLDPTLPLNLNSFRVRQGDKLYLIAHSHPPEALFSLHEPSLDKLSRTFSLSNPELAFWIGILGMDPPAQFQEET
jgi:hypothetical protein